MDKQELMRKIYWLEDKLLRAKDFRIQLKIHEEINEYRRALYKLNSREKHAL